MCVRMRHILVVNSYPDPPISEILYTPLEFDDIIILGFCDRKLAG